MWFDATLLSPPSMCMYLCCVPPPTTFASDTCRECLFYAGFPECSLLWYFYSEESLGGGGFTLISLDCRLCRSCCLSVISCLSRVRCSWKIGEAIEWVGWRRVGFRVGWGKCWVDWEACWRVDWAVAVGAPTEGVSSSRLKIRWRGKSKIEKWGSLEWLYTMSSIPKSQILSIGGLS
jgi:hypothetical protein